MTLSLVAMTAERYVSWNENLVVAFAGEKVDAGQWPEQGSVERAAAEQAALLPDGLDTVGHDLFVGTVDGEEVGVLWLFTDPALETPETFIYDIEVAPERRGQGFGRELVEAAEAWCADHSVGILRLHVFAFNETAISLYESAGFEISSHHMTKQIR